MIYVHGGILCLAWISQLDFGQRTPLATGSDYTIAPPRSKAIRHDILHFRARVLAN